jgi:hypothetical protein
MQAIELQTHDDFLAQYNLTIDTSDVIEYMKKARRIWNSPYKKYLDGLGTFYTYVDFKNQFSIDLAEILTSDGFCYSFNIVDASELLKLEG